MLYINFSVLFFPNLLIIYQFFKITFILLINLLLNFRLAAS